MSVISGDEKNKLIKLLQDRGVKFYHACQYKDFQTYIKLGGIPSRNLMQTNGEEYTPFDTDEDDKTNSVWNKVFGNFTDSGNFFAYASRKDNTSPIPNSFGPILLIFNPEIFEEATDVAICLRSAGGKNFNRDNEALSSAAEVEGIFTYKMEELPGENVFESSQIKFPSELKKDFKLARAGTPEISCTVENEVLSFNHIWGIRIDPYVINSSILFDSVYNLKRKNGIDGWIKARGYKDDRFKIKQELAELLIEKEVDLKSLLANQEISAELKDWAQRLTNGGREFDFNRFSDYLRSGTVLLLNEEEPPEKDVFNLDFMF